jgi:hypothetical protein
VNSLPKRGKAFSCHANSAQCRLDRFRSIGLSDAHKGRNSHAGKGTIHVHCVCLSSTHVVDHFSLNHFAVLRL